MSDWIPDIYGYLDYRAYLRDFYAAGKQHSSAFSYRYLARRAGFASPNFIKLVMEGQRNLGGDSPERVATAFGLAGAEAEFFHKLVAFDQATETSDRNEAYAAIAASQRFRTARRLEHDAFEYLSHWYYPAIRELAARADFREDPEWVASQLRPRVRAREAERALEVLFGLGLLVRSAGGSVSRGEPSITTGHEVAVLAARNYHYQMLDRARGSIEAFSREQRDVSALTVCIPNDLVDELKSRIHRFREELLELCDSSSDPEVVYQLTVQLFPLSRPEDEE